MTEMIERVARARLPVDTDLCRWYFDGGAKSPRFVEEPEATRLILAFSSSYIYFEWPSQADLAEQVSIALSAAFRLGQRDKAEEVRNCLGIGDWHEEQHPG